MKTQMTLALVAAFTLTTVPMASFAEEGKHEEHADHSQADKKPGRKKRVLMCKDCGKPESKCDCPEELKEKERQEAAKKKAEAKE